MTKIVRCFSGQTDFMYTHIHFTDDVEMETEQDVPDEGVTEFWVNGSKEELDRIVEKFEDADPDGEEFGGWWDEREGEQYGRPI